MTPIDLLKQLAEGSGGTNIREAAVAGQVGVVFELPQGPRVERFRYFVRGDGIFIRQLTGHDEGKEAEFATLSALLAAQAD